MCPILFKIYLHNYYVKLKFQEKRRLLFSTTDPLLRIGTPTPPTRTAQPHQPAPEKIKIPPERRKHPSFQGLYSYILYFIPDKAATALG